MKNEKKTTRVFDFLYSKNIANFEVFRLVISSSTNLLFLNSGMSCLGEKKKYEMEEVKEATN